MDDEVSIFSNRGGVNRVQKLLVRATSYIHQGAADKQKLTADMTYESKKKSVQLVERDGQHGTLYRKWLAMKAAGLPVVPTMRQTDRDTVVMTDLRADGSELYGKGLGGYILDRIQLRTVRPREKHPLDDRFLELMRSPQDLQKIMDKAAEYAQMANAAGILLPEDDPFELVIHPDRSWDLVCLDIESAMIGSRDPQQENETAVDFFKMIITDERVLNYLSSQ